MKINTFTILLILAVIAVMGLACYSVTHPVSDSKLGIAPSITAATTNSSSSIGTTTIATILSANSAALFRDICNPATGTLYIWLNSTSTNFTTPSGIPVYSGTCFQMSEQLGNMWLGTIYGLMSNGSSTITFHEQ